MAFCIAFRLLAPISLGYAAILVLLLLSCTDPPAQAQTSVTLKKGQLEQVKQFQARREYQIIDESPVVKDLRQPKESGPNYVINVGPGPTSSAPGTVVLTPERNNLAPSGFQTQIPARGFSKPGLAPATMGGHAPTDAVARAGKQGGGTRPLMSTSGKVAQQSPPTATAPASYKKYEGAGSNAFDTRFTTQTKADLHGKLLPSK
jgi:hypothetical protein